jgi:CubicO group peptidase (beta-lactamase class C family)
MHAKTDDPQKRAMTLADLLTMSGGYFCDDTNPAAPGNEELMEEQQEEGDYYRFTLNVPMATPPGENSVYCSGMANLALGVVGAAAGESPLYVFDRLVARPMQIKRYSYGIDRAGNPYGGGSVKLLSRDFIKLGQLMLNGGVWNKQRVLDREFAAAATSPLYNLRNIGYGYLYWNEDLPYKDRMVQSYSARGAGGQTVTVIPQLDLVVATMAGNYSSSKGMRAVSTDLVFRSILPAVREPGDDKNAPVVEREYTSPYGPSTNGSRRRPPS